MGVMDITNGIYWVQKIGLPIFINLELLYVDIPLQDTNRSSSANKPEEIA
jgi:hypothetical protein